MNKTQRRKMAVKSLCGLLLVVPAALSVTSCSGAEGRAAELVTASADMLRCMAGDDVKLDKVNVHLGYERRTVLDFPDIRTAKPCLDALDVVQAKWDAYNATWFNSTKAKDDSGIVLGERFQKAHDRFRELPLDKSTDVVFVHRDKYGSVLEAGDIAFELYDAARGMYVKDGARDKDIEQASAIRKREAPKVARRAPRGTVVATIPGKVKPVDWSVYPSGKGMVFHALSADGEMVVAWTDDGSSWKTSKGPAGFKGRAALELRVIDAPGGQRWFIVAHGEKDDTQTYLGRVVEGSLPVPDLVPPPPTNWKRAPGGEREVVVLANGEKAFPVWRTVEKSSDEKRAEKKERAEWNKNLADKDVQTLLTLAEERRLAREALAIDDDHKRLDGIAYAVGTGEMNVLELPDYGLGGLISGAEPMALVGVAGLPAYEMVSFAIPRAGEPVGRTTRAVVAKPIDPAPRGSPSFRCMSSDGTSWFTTATRSFLIGMQPDMLQLVQMAVAADDGTHLGCGPDVVTVALPFAKDRIFADLITIRGGETEGGRVPATAGTTVDMYNATSSTSVSSGATVIGWAARGYAIYSVNLQNDNTFMAPNFLAEPDTEGSSVAGLQFVGMGKRMVGFVAREACANEGSCTTSFEMVVSDDDARSWSAPN